MKRVVNKYGAKTGLLCLAMIGCNLNLLAEGPPAHSSMNNPLAIALVSVAIVLLLAIGMLAYVLIGASEFFLSRLKEKTNSVAAKTTVLLLALFTSIIAHAQNDATAATASSGDTISGLSTLSFYILVAVIALELLIILWMLLFLQQLLAKEKPASAAIFSEAKEPLYLTWWNKLNNLRPVQEEADIMLDHNYDGIRELDNKLPPWWLYGFYICIIFAGVYLYRYHVSHSAPLPLQEYEMAIAQATVEKDAYLKTAANNVNENTVTLITDAAALEEGKKMFVSTCVACHGAQGQGGVGPNLTDDYWLHKGGVKDIFKTIKYGVPEKGMKSWKDDFSAAQIASLASYIKTLHGTKPANPKDPQGDLFTEDTKLAADSATKATDTKVPQTKS